MPFEKEIKEAAEKYQIPYELLYSQVKQESSFNPLAVSRCGARGLLQLMPLTGAEMGLKDHEFFDVEKNLHAGAAYLNRMFKAGRNMIFSLPKTIKYEFISNDELWKFALASYNGGLGYVIKAMNLCIQDDIAVCYDNTTQMLADVRCVVRGKRPDSKQITDYVKKIWTNYARMKAPIENRDKEA